MVTLRGSDFSSDTDCLFGSKKGEAFPVPGATSTVLGCISPAGQALGPVSVQVVVGMNDGWIPSDVSFLYYPALTVTRVQPSSAQIKGGEAGFDSDRVMVYGEGEPKLRVWAQVCDTGQVHFVFMCSVLSYISRENRHD